MAETGAPAVDQDMTIDRADFLRRLPAAVGGVPLDVAGDVVRGGRGAGAFRIELAALPELRLGGLALARLRVRIFLSGDAAARRAFVERFELHYRRGGG